MANDTRKDTSRSLRGTGKFVGTTAKVVGKGIDYEAKKASQHKVDVVNERVQKGMEMSEHVQNHIQTEIPKRQEQPSHLSDSPSSSSQPSKPLSYVGNSVPSENLSYAKTELPKKQELPSQSLNPSNQGTRSLEYEKEKVPQSNPSFIKTNLSKEQEQQAHATNTFNSKNPVGQPLANEQGSTTQGVQTYIQTNITKEQEQQNLHSTNSNGTSNKNGQPLVSGDGSTVGNQKEKFAPKIHTLAVDASNNNGNSQNGASGKIDKTALLNGQGVVIKTLAGPKKTAGEELIERINSGNEEDMPSLKEVGTVVGNSALGKLNKHTFDFKANQGKLSKTMTVIGRTTAGAGKFVNKTMRLSKKVDRVTSGEDGSNFGVIQTDIQKKEGKVAFKTTKKGIKFARHPVKSILNVKSSISKKFSTAKSGVKLVKHYGTLAVKSVGKAIGSMVSALSPYMSASLVGAMVLVMVIALAGSGVAAQDYCSGSFVNSDGTAEGNAMATWSYYKSKGLSDYAVAGIMGNMEKESGFNPAAIESNGEGYGLIQWSFTRKANLLKEATLKGVSWTDLSFQLEYLWNEALVQTSYYGQRLNNAGFYTSKSARDCANMFNRIVEGSADTTSGRADAAQEWYDRLHGNDKVTDSIGCPAGSVGGNPDFTNDKAWKAPSNPYAPTFYGQCTWFAWGRFYEIYGFSPGFTGNGYACVAQLLQAHPDKFEFGLTPKVGAVGSSDVAHNHVWIVTGVEGDRITVQEGNLDGASNSWDVAITDWHTTVYTMAGLKQAYGNVTFANPK